MTKKEEAQRSRTIWIIGGIGLFILIAICVVLWISYFTRAPQVAEDLSCDDCKTTRCCVDQDICMNNGKCHPVDLVYGFDQDRCFSDDALDPAQRGHTVAMRQGASYFYDTCITTTGGDFTAVDSCHGKECFVDKAYCSNNEMKRTQFGCPGGCEHGACTNRDDITNIRNMLRYIGPDEPMYPEFSQVVNDTCVDSDNGNNYAVKGSTHGKRYSTSAVFDDESDLCTTNTALIEYYCNGDVRFGESYECPRGCKEGACLP